MNPVGDRVAPAHAASIDPTRKSPRMTFDQIALQAAASTLRRLADAEESADEFEAEFPTYTDIPRWISSTEIDPEALRHLAQQLDALRRRLGL